MASSYHMEKEGLIRCLSVLNTQGFTVQTLVTDRHRQIGKWMREEMPHVQHLFDVWHVAKGSFVHACYFS